MFRYIEISLSSLIFSTTLNKKNGIKITLISKFKKLEIYKKWMWRETLIEADRSL
jgi:hypothetical protein